MRTDYIQDSDVLGIFSIAAPLVWGVTAAVGFALVSNWPELFAPPTLAQAAPAAVGVIAAGSQPVSDPQAGSAFPDREAEPVARIDGY